MVLLDEAGSWILVWNPTLKCFPVIGEVRPFIVLDMARVLVFFLLCILLHFFFLIVFNRVFSWFRFLWWFYLPATFFRNSPTSPVWPLHPHHLPRPCLLYFSLQSLLVSESSLYTQICFFLFVLPPLLESELKGGRICPSLILRTWISTWNI